MSCENYHWLRGEEAPQLNCSFTDPEARQPCDTLAETTQNRYDLIHSRESSLKIIMFLFICRQAKSDSLNSLINSGQEYSSTVFSSLPLLISLILIVLFIDADITTDEYIFNSEDTELVCPMRVLMHIACLILHT